MELVAEMLRQPAWLVFWIGWMGAVNCAAVAFLRQREARWVLAAFVIAFVMMNLLYALSGYTRLLGLAHVVAWTPLLFYLAPRVGNYASDSPYGMWLRALLVTNALSLVVDYIDVARYLLGERS